MLWNPHIHMMVTDGGFDKNRWFHALPDVSTEPFLKVWEHHVFTMLIDHGRIKPELAKEMAEWDYTGFSVHKDVRIGAGDEEGLTRLSEYIARCPVAEAKITQNSLEDKIIYNADHPNPLPFQDWRANPDSNTTKRNFEVFEPLDFLAHRSCHLPVARGMTSIRSASGHPAHPGPWPAFDKILRLVFQCLAGQAGKSRRGMLNSNVR